MRVVPSPATMVASLALEPGQRFAETLEIVERMAEGGMGAVFRVRDLKAGEERALKVLHAELVSDPVVGRRFTQEAKIAAQIPSAHVAKIFAAGVDEPTGLPYILMELLHGRTLRDHVEAHGRLAPDETMALMRELGHGLGTAHRLGLVHRDVKPENIFLEDTEGRRRVKLLDFGVAKVIEARRSAATGTGAVGSPLWMAPEQSSAGGRISPATDVFSLGLVAYWMLTGSPYWRCAQGRFAIAALIRELHFEPMDPPSKRAAELDPPVALPPGFDAWFARVANREIPSRLGNAAEAVRELVPVLAPDSALAKAPPEAFASTLEVPKVDPDEVSDEAETVAIDREVVRSVRPPVPVTKSVPPGPPMSGYPPAPPSTAPSIPPMSGYPPAPSAPPPAAPSISAYPSAHPPRDPSPSTSRTAPSLASRGTSGLTCGCLVVAFGLVLSVLTATGLWWWLGPDERGETIDAPIPEPAPLAPVLVEEDETGEDALD